MGTFRLHHHNLPLVRQIAQLPLLGLNLAGAVRVLPASRAAEQGDLGSTSSCVPNAKSYF
ncbi:MAG: hypothetical protein U0835_09245 [Isosphaeraceae bacterium]